MRKVLKKIKNWLTDKGNHGIIYQLSKNSERNQKKKIKKVVDKETAT